MHTGKYTYIYICVHIGIYGFMDMWMCVNM